MVQAAYWIVFIYCTCIYLEKELFPSKQTSSTNFVYAFNSKQACKQTTTPLPRAAKPHRRFRPGPDRTPRRTVFEEEMTGRTCVFSSHSISDISGFSRWEMIHYDTFEMTILAITILTVRTSQAFGESLRSSSTLQANLNLLQNL